MKIAITSDVHANLPALEAVLAAAEAAGAESVWCLGDVVDYGPHPGECVDRVAEAAAVTIVGNHDLAVAGLTDLAAFSHIARVCSIWSSQQLSPTQIDWLAALPSEHREGAVGLWHGSPRDPVWEYVSHKHTAAACFEATDAKMILVGHTHVPVAYRLRADIASFGPAALDLKRRTRNLHPQPAPGAPLELGEDRWVINPGSVGFPRAERDTRAQWGLLDLDAGTFTFQRTDYDREQTKADLIASGTLAELARWV